MELSCGQQLKVDKKYWPAGHLAADLHLDLTQVVFDQPLGPDFGWYRGYSAVTYYQESLAAEQAQQTWDRSTVVASYRNGKVSRARYGVEEVETGYSIWMGGCENPERPWKAMQQTRAQYMADLAMELTLIHALDVDGFRAYAGFSIDSVDDDRLLVLLHERRSRAIQIPPISRAESERWLKDHGETVSTSRHCR